MGEGWWLFLCIIKSNTGITSSLKMPGIIKTTVSISLDPDPYPENPAGVYIILLNTKTVLR